MKSAYDKVRAARATSRPTGLSYIENIFSDFIELHGDRRFADDSAICGGLAFFDWDGVENLTPDQLFGWYVAGYSPGVNDTEVDATSVEQYFYAYTGYHLENPEILRQSQYYDSETQAYRVQGVEGVIGADDYNRQYWCDYGEVTYPDENTALVPVKIYEDESRSQLLADGVMKMKYQGDPSDPWIIDGFTSN